MQASTANFADGCFSCIGVRLLVVKCTMAKVRANQCKNGYDMASQLSPDCLLCSTHTYNRRTLNNTRQDSLFLPSLSHLIVTRRAGQRIRRIRPVTAVLAHRQSRFICVGPGTTGCADRLGRARSVAALRTIFTGCRLVLVDELPRRAGFAGVHSVVVGEVARSTRRTTARAAVILGGKA